MGTKHRRASAVFPLSGGMDWAGVVTSDADSVELKLLLPPRTDPRPLLATRHGPRWRSRRTHLFDTPAFDLSGAGVHLRLRRRGAADYELTARARRPARPHADAARPPGARVELDIVPGEVMRTTEVRRRVDPELAAACVAGELPAARMLSVRQSDWLADTLDTDLPDDLRPHGPLVVERVGIPRARFPLADAHLERCTCPSGLRLAEFSVRCAPRDAPRVAAATSAFLDTHDVSPAPPHRLKTAVWLDELLTAGAG